MLITHRSGLCNIPSRLEDITTQLTLISSKRSLVSVVSRLVFAASCYFIWQERNKRIYSNDTRKEEQVCEAIFETVRLKLVSLRFKRTTSVMKSLQVWKIPVDIT